MVSKPGVMVLNFGGPRNEQELVPFLSLLLDDVLPFPEMISRPMGAMIARMRGPKVQPNYEMIGWSPLVETHDQQVAALKERLDPDLPVASGMMFTPPFAKQGLESLLEQGVDHIVAVPMFPHYSFATTHAAYSFMFTAMEELGIGNMPVHWVPAYYDHPLYLDALASTIRTGVERTPGEGPTHLVFTPHGLPLSFPRRGDPYPEQIRETARQVIRHMGWDGEWSLGWQSRVGPSAWLSPSTPEVMGELAQRGVQRVTLVPVAFVSEHIETLHEIDIEYAEDAHKMGIPHFGRAPALGLEPAFIDCLADLVRTGLASFERYSCVRCLHPKPDAHRRQTTCPNCRFTFPNYLRRGVQTLS
ncbi:MAG: ferrochelatase [Alphaproteobacteria bacterium]|nr:ferrochelatase [Alphaproteobacteria bacterium]